MGELVKKEEGAISITQMASEWGAPDVTSKDIIIPAVYLMQPMSDRVTAGDAAFGEFIESLTNTKLGKFEDGFEIIPFFMEKLFMEYNIDDPKKKVWLRSIPITPENESKPYEDEEKTPEGKVIKITRDRCMRFFFLIPAELEAGTALPYTITVRRTSLNAGKKLSTQMYIKNLQAKKTPASTVLKITAKKETNDQGTYAVLDVMPLRASTDAQVAQAFEWLKLLKTGKAKVDEALEDQEPTTVASKVEQGPAQF